MIYLSGFYCTTAYMLCKYVELKEMLTGLFLLDRVPPIPQLLQVGLTQELKQPAEREREKV